MSIVEGAPWEPIEPTARLICMLLRIAQMDQADGSACLVLAFSMWMETDPHMTPDLALRVFEASSPSILAAFEMLRTVRDAENR